MKKCRICKSPYAPHSSLQRACGPTCALALVKLDNERKAAKVVKESRQWVRQQKERLKTRGDHTKEAQQAFNAYIRARDSNLPCISCGTHSAGQFHAGHYRTTKAAPELRFDESNVNKQCAQCNNFDSGNITEYRISLINRVGQKEVDRLEGLTPPKHYSVDEIKEIKAKYRRLTREIQRERMAA
jgi:FtsZ-binding cell division protein ZapB